MTLGLATCNAETLFDYGPGGCSPNAVMGTGIARVELPFGSVVLRETAYVTAVMGPPAGNTTVILFYAEGNSPVAAQVVFPDALQSASMPFGILLDVTVPLISTVPGGPDVAVTDFWSTIGPSGIRYVKRVHGKVTTYTPAGLSVPTVCPRTGFTFRGAFAFADGSRVTATSTVPCPDTMRSSRHKVHR
jgi:hypothetical protein